MNPDEHGVRTPGSVRHARHGGQERRPSDDERAAWSRLARLVARSARPAEVFAAVVGEASGLLDGAATTLSRFEEDGALVVVARNGSPPAGERSPAPVRPGALVAVPVEVAGAVWGYLGATSSHGPFPDAVEHRLEPFAHLVAAAVGSDRARSELRALADEQAALRRVAELVARGGELEEVFAAAVAEASALLGGLPLAFVLQAPAGAAGGFGVASSMVVPVVVDGRTRAAIVVQTPGVPPSARATACLARFAELVSVAIADAEARTALSASRARIVAAADESRRRLQRDVHDGAQQRLVYAVIVLTLARDAVEAGSVAAGLLEDALVHVQRANSELRDVVHGILPRSLTHGGLRMGLESLVADLPLPADVRVTVPRLPAPTETTAYFVVAEALTNAVKHSRARGLRLRVDLEGDVLVVEVRDDGVGGADPARGTGLTGLSDRVGAAGGTLTVSSPTGGGTTLRAELPVSPMQG